MSDNSVIVIGGGVAGLTAAALLSNEGVPVKLFESHHQLGGCAGTFRRGPYLFDVGATQVAGLETGGIHERLFRYLKCSMPAAELLDPACLVDLCDGSKPIRLWHDPQRWLEERQRQFPGSESFWALCSALHKSNWVFSGRDPVLPSRSFWDFFQLLKAIRFQNIAAGLLVPFSIYDLLKVCGCNTDSRLKKFLDLQLRLYSQEPSETTAALYGATVLQMAQAPLGLWHIYGSMQKISDELERCCKRNGSKIFLKHKVVGLTFEQDKKINWTVDVIDPNGLALQLPASDIVCSLPPQSLLKLMKSKSKLSDHYLETIRRLPRPSSAVVFYGALPKKALPIKKFSHYQLATKDLGSLFISISQDGDGRAPLGKLTFIASAFSRGEEWFELDKITYKQKKEDILSKIMDNLQLRLNISRSSWLHTELATPKSFAYWTGRPYGIVGGLGQHPLRFGPFGLSSRTPIKGLWLCGDSIHPGEGTAGVSQSSLMVVRQLLASRGYHLNIPK